VHKFRKPTNRFASRSLLQSTVPTVAGARSPHRHVSPRFASAPLDDRGRPTTRLLRDSTNRCASQMLLRSTIAGQRGPTPCAGFGRATSRLLHRTTEVERRRARFVIRRTNTLRESCTGRRVSTKTRCRTRSRRTPYGEPYEKLRGCEPGVATRRTTSSDAPSLYKTSTARPIDGHLSHLRSLLPRKQVPWAFLAPEVVRLRRLSVTAANSISSSSRVESHDRKVHLYSQANCEDRRPFHGVWIPYDACRSRQRPTPGLPHPAVLRLQVFSTS
jgi:hypothetical protein